MKKLLFIICIISTTISFAKKWDAVYINNLITKGDIDKVIQHYQEGYYSTDRNPQDAFKIAELYVKKKDYASAVQWYDKEKQLLNTSKVNLLNYANTNRLMGEYQKALDGYLMYAANTGDAGKVMDLANQCEKILKLSSQVSNYKLDNYTYNTSNNETNVAFLRTNAVYTTTNIKDESLIDINQVVRNYEGFAPPAKAYQNNIPNIIITSLSYSKDGNTVVFSAKEEKSSGKKNIKIYEKIYIANNLAGNFLDVKALPFNSEGYSFKNPSFNDDGTVIYFSSNRTGGFGGFDIWKSSFENKKWSLPTNLGKLINTKYDEINPFIVQDKNENLLYFSSDRIGGFGGFDIYSAKKSNNIWQDSEMQPAPINSEGDDNSIVFDNEIKIGYFSSNRKGGKGGFDLYRYTPFNLRIIINTIDSTTKKTIDYAYTQLNENGIKAFDGVTNENGKAIFQVGRDKTFKINISKDNYRPASVVATSIGKSNGDSVVLNIALIKDDNYSVLNGKSNAITLENYITFTGNVVDGATNKAAKNAKMRMVNYNTQKLREIDIDKNGNFELKLLQNNNYKVIFENQSYKIYDELTTYGLEKNDIKLRDYLISSGKLKITNNKVYKDGNVPARLGVDNDASSSVSINHEPITQAKIDSLLKVIENDNPQINQTIKPTTNKKPIENILPEKEVEKQTIVVGTGDAIKKKTTSPTIITIEKETDIMVADIVTKNTSKKIITLTDEDEELTVERVFATSKPKTTSIETPKEVDTKKTEIIKNNNAVENDKILNSTKEDAEKTAQEKLRKIKKILDDDDKEDAVLTKQKSTNTKVVTAKEVAEKTAQTKVKSINNLVEDGVENEVENVKEKTQPAKIVTTKEVAEKTAQTKSTTIKNNIEDEVDNVKEKIQPAKTITAKEFAEKTAQTKSTAIKNSIENEVDNVKEKTPPVKTITAKEVAEKTAQTKSTAIKNNIEDEVDNAKEKIQPVKTITTKEVAEQTEQPEIIATKNSIEDKVSNKIDNVIEKTQVLSREKDEIEKIENQKLAEVKQDVKTQTVISAKPKVIPVEELPDNYYKIQLASYDEENLEFPEFDHLGKVEIVKTYNKYIYRLGIFTDLDKAKQVLDEVRTKGYFVAFILQYKKDKVTGVIK